MKNRWRIVWGWDFQLSGYAVEKYFIYKRIDSWAVCNIHEWLSPTECFTGGDEIADFPTLREAKAFAEASTFNF